MHIKGRKVNGSTLHLYNEHRIAMMGAIDSLVSEEPINIEKAEAVGESHLTFFLMISMY